MAYNRRAAVPELDTFTLAERPLSVVGKYFLMRLRPVLESVNEAVKPKSVVTVMVVATPPKSASKTTSLKDLSRVASPKVKSLVCGSHVIAEPQTWA